MQPRPRRGFSTARRLLALDCSGGRRRCVLPIGVKQALQLSGILLGRFDELLLIRSSSRVASPYIDPIAKLAQKVDMGRRGVERRRSDRAQAQDAPDGLADSSESSDYHRALVVAILGAPQKAPYQQRQHRQPPQRYVAAQLDCIPRFPHRTCAVTIAQQDLRQDAASPSAVTQAYARRVEHLRGDRHGLRAVCGRRALAKERGKMKLRLEERERDPDVRCKRDRPPERLRPGVRVAQLALGLPKPPGKVDLPPFLLRVLIVTLLVLQGSDKG